MPEFFNVLPPDEALSTLLDQFPLASQRLPEGVPLLKALGRVTAEEIRASADLPSFPRSTVDGYSLRAADTFGASQGLPAWFTVVGEVPMGCPPLVHVGVGEAAVTYTGGMLADGADAVVMVEHIQQIDSTTIEVARPAAPGENVVQPGEDVRCEDVVLAAGHVLNPQDLGGLAAVGVTNPLVFPQPRVGILSMGDEVVPPDLDPGPGQIRDVNTYTVAALVRQSGGLPVPLPLVGDDYEEQLDAARQGLEQSDVLVFSAGSSVSNRDLTADIINQLGEPGVLVHGLALRPGKPAIVGLVEGKPVFGLPGNPVSAMIVFDLLVRPVLFHWSGVSEPPLPSLVSARLAQNIASATGREDYVPVKLVVEGGETVAIPVFGKSNLIFTLIRADGLVKVALDKGGLYAGTTVPVRLFQP